MVAGKTGRHNYTEWDQVLQGEGAPHPALNPNTLPQNEGCRRAYNREMCARSLDILNRTVMVATHPLHGEQETADIIHNVGMAARVARGGMSLDEADFRNAEAVDRQKFDMAEGQEAA